MTTAHKTSETHSRRSVLLGLAAAPLAACATSGAGARAAGAASTAATSATSPGGVAGRGPFPAQGLAAHSANGPLEQMQFQRRALGPKDVAIQLHYCGVCHSDI